MPLHDLDQNLAQLDPEIIGTYYFVTLDRLPVELEPFAIIRESEGVTAIVNHTEVQDYSLPTKMPMARISLGAYTSLEAVGITATVAQTLASRGIACNVIAGYHHDHIFVPLKRAEEAQRLLQGLVIQAKGWLPENLDD